VKVNFQEVRLYATKSVKCPDCGKRLKRSRKFYQTMNPFNKLPDGTVKSADDIYRELRAQAKAWEATAVPEIRHSACPDGN